MATPVNGLTSAMNRIAPHLSENMLATNNSLFQRTGITSAIKRPKTANPGGWSRRKSRDVKKIPLDIQNSVLPPSTWKKDNMEMKTLQPTSSRDSCIKVNLYEKLNYFSNRSPKKNHPRPHSLERLSSLNLTNKLNREIDRENDHWTATDRQPPLPQEKIAATVSTVGSVTKENAVLAKSIDVKEDEGTTFDKRESNIEEVAVETTCDLTSSENSGEHEVLLSNEKGISGKENGVEVLNTGEIVEKTTENDVDKLFKISQEILENFPEKTGPNKNDDWSTSLQRTVDINLNELGTTNPELRKKLSMDINVVVRVKSQDGLQKPEIGFQELPEYRKVKELGKEKSKGNQQEISKLYSSSETGILSQKDLTEEIGKVYNFLKNSEPIENSPSNSFDIFQNFEKIKQLYFNALKCVKSFKELKGTKTSTVQANDDQSSDLVSLEGELAKFFSEKGNSSHLTPLFKYPIAIEKVHDSAQYNECQESCPSHNGQKKQFLSGKTPGMMSVRTYAEGPKKSDCLKAKKLPCLESTELSKGGAKDAGASTRSVCEKLCMPCCKPARDPPLCFYPYHKPPCKKEKPPRPAFSECKQFFEMRQVAPCECVRPRATSCKKSADSEKCHKR